MMYIRVFILPLAALAGISFSIFMVVRSLYTPPIPFAVYTPAQSPYQQYIAGEGIVEAYNDNIPIGTSTPDLISTVYVHAGQSVKKGDPLFKLDTRQQEADLQEALANLARVKTEYLNATVQYDFYEHLKTKTAVSAQEYTRAYYAKKIAADTVKVALATVMRIKTSIERAHIRAPIDGLVLQSNVHPGDFANINPFDRSSLMIIGDVSTLQLRVNIAEEDAWRVKAGAPGTAFVRGNNTIKIPLTFLKIEPLLIPKRSLTGSDTEQVDTRVLQILYTFSPKDHPIYTGQLLDVYLEAKPSEQA